MAYVRPELSEINARLQADAQSHLTSYPNRRELAATLIKVLSGASHEWYGALDEICKQLFWTTAEGSNLERWASIFGLQRRLATKAAGTVQFTFSDAPVAVPAGTVLITASDIAFVTTSDVSPDGQSTVEAVTPGTTSNVQVGVDLSLTSPIAGVMRASVLSLSLGTDDETDENLRARLLYKTQNPPRGGTAADYVSWTLEVAGVTRAWCYPHEPSTGEVTIRFMTDGLTDDGIPTGDLVATVTNHLTEVAPIGAVLQVVPPVKELLDVTVSGLVPSNLTIQEQIKAKLQEVIFDEAQPGSVIYRSHLSSAIASIPEVVTHEITVPNTEIITPADKALFMLGEVTFA